MAEGCYKNREEMVYENLKQDILNLELKPGQLLKETELCERFGVSRTPVRDALRMLQEQGFVLTVPYKGIYVTLLSLNNIKQMIYMRVAVETMVLRDFIKEASTPLVMEDIRYMIRKQQAIIKEPDFKPEQFYHLDAQMHGIWFEATRKQKLWEILQAQQLHYTRFRMLDFVTETDFTRIIREHKKMFELIEKKDVVQVEETLKNHLYFSMKRMRHQIDVEYREYFEEEPEEGKFDI
ncbi:MAG: GntR family transcriptional regulator [Lachnospiraceae bacterium]|nr:GntR family transcriptional regulator [Lachnospiraceae bacterium]